MKGKNEMLLLILLLLIKNVINLYYKAVQQSDPCSVPFLFQNLEQTEEYFSKSALSQNISCAIKSSYLIGKIKHHKF